MKMYLLTERDFNELFAMVKTIEVESKLEEPPSAFVNSAEGRILRKYRYRICEWMDKVKKSDEEVKF